MPFSSNLGKDTIRQWLRETQYASVLDVGAGAGVYSNWFRYIRPLASWTALEVHEPYVSQFDLKAKYDDVIVQDVCSIGFPPSSFDVVVLGDVVEHLYRPEAIDLISSARRWAAKAVVLSIPLGSCPQEAVNGNEHEIHRSTWEHLEIMHKRPTCARVHRDTEYTIGTYLWRTEL